MKLTKKRFRINIPTYDDLNLKRIRVFIDGEEHIHHGGKILGKDLDLTPICGSSAILVEVEWEEKDMEQTIAMD